MIALLLTASVSASFVVTNATCYYKDGRYTAAPGINPLGVANAVYNQSINASGWYQLRVTGNATFPDAQIAYCAGYVEGYLSAYDIYNHFSLIKDIKGYPRTAPGSNASWYPEPVYGFIESNRRFVAEAIEAFVDDPWWREVGLIYQQFLGLAAGYNDSAALADHPERVMGLFDHWFMQSAGDMFDIAEIFHDNRPTQEFRDHCSGLVKITENYDDIFFAHDAWSDFRELHGQLKEYRLNLKAFRAKRIILSTRIGKLSSYDDFYITDSGLFVLETTMNNYNDSLYDRVVPECVFTWMRAVHACWTAENGSDWGNRFVRHNSGTYNNQYVIVDTNKFVRKSKPTTDLLWIVEQFPGVYRMTDVTFQLVRDTYFPSVNMPWHDDLYALAGYPAYVASLGIYGDYRSNYKGPRYLIAQRDAKRIKTFENFTAFMRYNQWWRDPYSQGDAAQQIASRYDQRPPSTPYGARNSFGDLDTKAVRWTEAATLFRFHAIASPPTNGITAWDFNTTTFNISWDGLPAYWDFPWLEFGAEDINPCPFDKSHKDDCINAEKWCGWCLASKKCMIGDDDGPWFDACDAGWSRKVQLKTWAIPLIVTVTVISVLFVAVVVGLHFFYPKEIV
jgi:hypothetical protein